MLAAYKHTMVSSLCPNMTDLHFVDAGIKVILLSQQLLVIHDVDPKAAQKALPAHQLHEFVCEL